MPGVGQKGDEYPVVGQNGAKNPSTDMQNEVQKLRRLNYILIVLMLLTMCFAVVALALAVCKGDSAHQTFLYTKESQASDACSSGPCINEGTCISIPPDNYVCSCVATYYGRNCEQKMTVRAEGQSLQNDACSSGPCGNQGTCISIPPDNYVCSCVATYYGRNCQHALKDASFFVTFNIWHKDIPDGTVITWDDVRYDPGNNYDTSTGAYTAPSDGYYQFSVTKRSQALWSNFYIMIDGAKRWYCANRRFYQQDVYTSCTVNTQLQAGQKVMVQQYLADNVHTLQEEEIISSWFTGQMLYPTP